MRVTLIDCYDSFTYNIVQALGVLGFDVTVLRCDEFAAKDVLSTRPSGLIIGPGPGRPEDAGNIIDAIHVAKHQVPLLGICLGHQAIGLAFGAQLTTTHPVHGHASDITHSKHGLFLGLMSPIKMTRYHSLIIEKHTLPTELVVTATANRDTIMAIQHRSLPIFGVQFHPESVLSGKDGLRVFANFKNEIRAHGRHTGVRSEHPDRVFEQRQ